MRTEKKLWRCKGLVVGAGAVMLQALLGAQMAWGQMQSASAPVFFPDGVWEIQAADYVSATDFLIGDAALLDVADGTQATLAGRIGNALGSLDGLIKLGGGALTLTGDNSYRGVTRVLQGGLVVGANGAVGPGIQANTGATLTYAPGVTVASNVQFDAIDMATQPVPPVYRVNDPARSAAVNWHVDSGQATHDGIVSGAAAFEKTGNGRLVLAKDALGYTGAAVVRAGTLAVNDWFGGSVQVASGGRLEGTGSIASVWVRDGATLAPGASIGVLRVPGNVRFDEGSTLSIEVEADGRHDVLAVGGQAVLAGNVQALAGAGDWKPSTSYRFLTADGGFDDTRFDGVTSNLAFLTPLLAYDETSVSLTLARNDVALGDPAVTDDEDAVADIIDAPPDGVPGVKDLPQVYDAIVVLDRDGARSAYRQLAGAWPATVRAGALDDSRFVREAVIGSRGWGERGNKVWSSAYGAQGSGRAAGSVGDFHRSLRGFTVGVRHLVNHLTEVGVFAGADTRHVRQTAAPDGTLVLAPSGGDDLPGGPNGGASADSVGNAVIRGGGADTRINSLHVGADVGAVRGPVQVDAGFSVAWHTFKTSRALEIGRWRDALRSVSNSRSMQIFGRLALLAGLSPFTGLSPFIEVALVHSTTNAHTEQGGAGALNYARAHDWAAFSVLGLKVSHAFKTVGGLGMLQAELAWRYAYADRHFKSRQSFRDSSRGTTFTSHGHGIAAHALKAAFTVSTPVGKHSVLQAGYSGLLSPGRRDHGFNLKFRHYF